MFRILRLTLGLFLVVALTGGVASASQAASTKKPAVAAKKSTDWRDNLTEEQKTKIRRAAREHCKKKFGGVTSIIRVELISGGRYRCWYYQ